MSDELDNLKREAELEMLKAELAHKKEIQVLRHKNEIQEELDKAPDEKLVGEDYALILMGVEEDTLERLRADGLPFEKYRGRTSKCIYKIGELRRYRDAHLVARSGAVTKRLIDGKVIGFGSLLDVLEQQPFWIKHVISEMPGSIGRDTIEITHEVVIGHVQTINTELFQELVQDPLSDILMLSLDDAMGRPWEDAKERQPFQTAYIEMLQRAIESAELVGC